MKASTRNHHAPSPKIGVIARLDNPVTAVSTQRIKEPLPQKCKHTSPTTHSSKKKTTLPALDPQNRQALLLLPPRTAIPAMPFPPRATACASSPKASRTPTRKCLHQPHPTPYPSVKCPQHIASAPRWLGLRQLTPTPHRTSTLAKNKIPRVTQKANASNQTVRCTAAYHRLRMGGQQKGKASSPTGLIDGVGTVRHARGFRQPKKRDRLGARGNCLFFLGGRGGAGRSGEGGGVVSW